ncbi:MAG: DUF4124 domain-containing protein [Deltaproteobacteria bacterium]|nr:DUF4124 domain-containing protein [Deltaproteobacteria bacterium]
MKTFVVAAVPAFSLFLTFSSVTAQGGIYKWTDAHGQVHFSNAPIGKATAVDDELPPASDFGTSPEPPPPTLASTPPAPTGEAPTPTTATAPPAEGEPEAAEPAAEGEPVLAGGTPPAIEEESPPLIPQASAELLEQAEPDDSAQDDLDTDESSGAEESDEENVE